MTMKSQDWMSQDNNRAEVVRKLVAYCADNDLEYTYTEKKFTVKLPSVEPLPVVPITTPMKKRKSFDISKWGEKSVDETNLPDELPPTTTPIEEGEAPKGDDEV